MVRPKINYLKKIRAEIYVQYIDRNSAQYYNPDQHIYYRGWDDALDLVLKLIEEVSLE